MKAVYNIVLVLAAAITLSLSGCNPATEPIATPDEIPVVATMDEAQTEPTTIIEETTVVETTVTETTVPETTAEVTEPTKAEEPEKTENKTSSNGSSDKKQNNSNNSSQTTNKPSNNTSSGNNSSGSSTNNKPAETKPKPVVVTDDTPLTYEEFVNDKNIQRLCDDVNAYFIAKGMIYTPSLNKDNSGWFYGYNSANDVTAIRSYNQHKSRTITCLDGQVEAVLVGLGGVTDLSLVRFNCYYEVTPQGYYDIYFCYG